MSKRAWRSPCAKCDKAPFMLCITCESMGIQRITAIKLVRKKRTKSKVKVPLVFSCIGR